MSAGLIERLIEAGTPAALVAEVAMELGRAEAERAILADRRKNERDRKAKSRDITGHHVTARDAADTPPVLDKETLSPTPPIKEINPTPRVGIALARKAGGFGPPENVAIGLWNEFCGQRKKPITQSAYTAILKKLAEGAEAGWPPGDLFTRALEGCWETIFVPKEIYNGRSRQNGLGTGAQQRGSNRQQDGFLNAIRDAADSFGPGERGGMPRAAGVG